MPQIGWLEILAVVIIAILVLGPKEFPIALKKEWHQILLMTMSLKIFPTKIKIQTKKSKSHAHYWLV